MNNDQRLKPARELAGHNRRDFPGDSEQYRQARTALLAGEIELRRHIERVAAQRRALPPGGKVPEDHSFMAPDGPVRLSELFGAKDTLVTYNWMFGPKRERPCPMCTSLLSALDGEMPDILQRVSFAVIATSPIERMAAFAKERGWRHLKLYSSAGNNFNRDYAGEEPGGDDNAAFNVFTRSGGTILHFSSDEMGMETADPGQDPRGAPDPMPLWTILDMTPEGRGTDWYPKLEYGRSIDKGGPAMSDHADVGDVVRTYFAAYPTRDRAAIESVIADDFHFTSPLDNRIDRRTYFERCWPNGDDMAVLDLQQIVLSGERVFVAYEIRMKDGRRFKNAELVTVKQGQIVDVEVYFGWTIPHKAPSGSFVPDKD